MRTLDVDIIRGVVRRMCVRANHEIRDDQIAALERGLAEEQPPPGCHVIGQLLENATVAAPERVAFCQNTGYAVVFLDIGQDVRLAGGSLSEAINAGVAEGYREGYLRASLVRSPIDREHRRQHSGHDLHEPRRG